MTRLGRPRRPAVRPRDAPPRRRRRGHDPRVAVHRPARVGPVQRGPRLRHGPAVREPHRVRHVRGVPSRHQRLPPRHQVGQVRDVRPLRRRHARPGACRRRSSRPSGRWQIVVIEDADRLGTPENPRTGNALLKAIEEPTPKTLWLLCAPTAPTCSRPSRPARGTSRCPPRTGEQSPPSWSATGIDPRRGRPSPPVPARGTSAAPAPSALDEGTRHRRREIVSASRPG